ncbi:MAG: glycosyltransferase family 2 protein [Chloroflexi bacterium]|jgi:glycosyltransferase involved in cell wall biosynthesis|nr:glycosyltransferase family 2 protein [Chloroflexota bacterium]
MHNLSIIIPHYNSINTLIRLLNSIPDRDDIQVIVVDDKSDQNPYEILSDEYARRVLFLDNQTEKKGAGTCRNIGLSNATGKWVLFADADDYFLDGFYDIIREFFNTDYDIIFFCPTSIDELTGKLSTRHRRTERYINYYLNHHDQTAELLLRFKLVTPWSKLINFEFINNHNIRFDEVTAANDVMFSTKVGHLMHNFFVSKQVIYCITRSAGSLTVSPSEATFDTRLQVFIDRYHYLQHYLSKANFKLLDLNGWYMIHYAFLYRLDVKKIAETYRTLRKNKISMWNPGNFKLLFRTKRIIRFLEAHKETQRFITKK